jgi:hypothetical protein
MDVLDDQIQAALAKGKEIAERESKAVAATFDAGSRRLRLDLSSGASLWVSPVLLQLSVDADLSDVQIEGGGLDLYFPCIDEGAYVPDICRAAFEMKLAA